MRVLTVDLGNSAGKVVAWEGGDVAERADFAHGEPVPLLGGELAFVSSVASADATRRATEALALAGCEVVLSPAPRVVNECDAAHTTGADRLYAARAAVDLVMGECVVVDCGTALTIDAARRDADGVRRFLGGAIAAGPALLARAVADGGARLPRFHAAPGDPALGRDTEGALRAGVAVGLRGAARELARRVAGEAGLPGAPVVLTGGARAFLLEPDACFEGEVRVDPDLVHRGLLAAGTEARGDAG